jgi:NADP-dependent 3-hydroxy acid dehydrogenase YdfG
MRLAFKHNFKDKIAIVTGASSGIGRATALALARQGVHLALASRREALLAELAEQIHDLGTEALVVPTDVTQRSQVVALVDETLNRWGRVDIMIANAGEYVRAPIRKLTVEDIDYSMSINFYGGLYAVLAVLPHMLDQNSGHIVLVTTMDAKKGLPPDAPYVSAKFALSGFGEVLRQELHDTGIGVTTVFPGRVDTPLIDDLKVPWISAKIPPEVVARAILGGIRRRRPEVITPKYSAALYYLNVLSPRLADWVVRAFHLEGWQIT